MWGRTALTGGTKAVDNIAYADISTGDLCIAVDSSKVLYFYRYNADSTAGEVSPETIEPNDQTGNGEWELVTSFRIGASSSPAVLFRDSDFSNTEAAKIYANAVDADNGDIFIQIEQGGSLVTVLTFDESTDQWITTKDFIGATAAADDSDTSFATTAFCETTQNYLKAAEWVAASTTVAGKVELTIESDMGRETCWT